MKKSYWAEKKAPIKGAICFLAFCWIFMSVGPALGDEIQDLKQELKLLNEKMQSVQQQLEEMETEATKKDKKMQSMEKKVNQSYVHAAMDKITLGAELRTRADTIHYTNALLAPSAMTQSFFTAPPMGFNGATLPQIQQGMANMAAAGMIPPPEEYSTDNDFISTNRFRLEMKSKITDKLSFGGRLAGYKVFGDSVGVEFNQGGLGDVYLDGTTSSLPHGDTIHLERAFFNYHNTIGSLPYSFSLGRRPSTEGPPLEYGNNSSEGGSPLATIINWQFDGASLKFDLEEATGISGADFKFCYGVGFEGDWGNSSSLNPQAADVDDVHMFGIIATLFNDFRTSVMLNYAHAWDVTDGFTGLTVMPFVISKMDTDGDGQAEYYFEPNSGAYVSRMEPTTNIGDWDAASVLMRTNLFDWVGDVDVFVAGSWSHTDPSRVSANPYFEMMGYGLLSSNGELEDRDGFSLYAGTSIGMPYKGRLGLEFNWGSKYWFNFTGAEDSLVGSKLAVRGKVYEAYYLQPLHEDVFFLKIGGQYYDYEYTGSGNPLGEPVKISEATSLDALNSIVDDVWLGYLAFTVRF